MSMIRGKNNYTAKVVGEAGYSVKSRPDPQVAHQLQVTSRPYWTRSTRAHFLVSIPRLTRPSQRLTVCHGPVSFQWFGIHRWTCLPCLILLRNPKQGFTLWTLRDNSSCFAGAHYIQMIKAQVKVPGETHLTAQRHTPTHRLHANLWSVFSASTFFQ